MVHITSLHEPHHVTHQVPLSILPCHVDALSGRAHVQMHVIEIGCRNQLSDPAMSQMLHSSRMQAKYITLRMRSLTPELTGISAGNLKSTLRMRL